MFRKIFWKHGKFPRITLSRHSTCFSLPGQYLPPLFPTTTKPLWSSRWNKNMAYLHSIYCKVKERIHGETSHTISIKMCKCVDGWMDEWWYGLLLKHWFSLSLSFIIPCLFFFKHGYSWCLTTKLSEVYLEEIDCRQGHAKIRTRWCKEHKDLDRFRPPKRNTIRPVWLFVLH